MGNDKIAAALGLTVNSAKVMVNELIREGYLLKSTDIHGRRVLNFSGKPYLTISCVDLSNIADDDSLFHPFIFKRTPKYKFHNVVVMSKGKYSGQWKSSFTFPGYTVDIITNTATIKNQWVVKSLSMNLKEFAVIETDEDVTKIETPILKIIEAIKK